MLWIKIEVIRSGDPPVVVMQHVAPANRGFVWTAGAGTEIIDREAGYGLAGFKVTADVRPLKPEGLP
jgi:hypothetical protein